MLYIPCPYCGPRNQTEFQYGAQAHVSYPNPWQSDDQEWARYVFTRSNPKGWHAERWLHTAGCRRWFNIWRHTVTHEFGESYKPFAEQPPRPL